MTANRIDRILIALIAAITAIGAVVWDIYTPYTVDDYFYREIIRADFSPTTETWPGGNEDITTLPQAWKSIKNHTVYNGRLANFLHILMQPAGRTAESVLLGLCIGALFLLLCKCIRSFSGPLTVPGIIAATLSFWIILPWHDTFQSMAFQCNYVLPSLVMLGMILLYSHASDLMSWRKPALYTLALLCPWLHEGFGCTAIAYFAAAALIPSLRPLRKTAIIVVAALCAGLALNLVCGTSNRIAGNESGGSFTMQTVVQVGSALWPFILAGAVAALMLFRKNGDRAKRARIYMPLLAGTLACAALALVFKRGDRVLWPCNTLCIIILCTAFNNMVLKRHAHRLTALAGAAFTVLYAWWFTEQCVWNKRVGDETRAIERIHGKHNSASPTVFFTGHIPTESIPYWLCGITAQPLENGWNVECAGTYLIGRTGGVLVLPKELEGIDFNEWPKVPGANKLRGIYPMIAARDSADTRLLIRFGAYNNNTSPVNKALAFVKNRGTIGATDSVTACATPLRIILPDSTTVFRYCPEALPRTTAGHKFISIDEIPQP